MDCSEYKALCSKYKPEREDFLTNWMYIPSRNYYSDKQHISYMDPPCETFNKQFNADPYTVDTKEDLIRYIKNDVNSVYSLAKELANKIEEGEPKVYYFIKDVEIKKKVSKKGSCMQYNFILYGSHAFLTIENYDEDCNLSADFILSLTHICYRCSVDKLIFRDHKVIAISKDQRCCGEDEKTKKSIWKKKSYVADCMDVDDYNPYIGATIAINKCVADSYYKKNSKSHLRRLREKIDRASEDFNNEL